MIMNERQAKLLAAIIDQFINTAIPVGSMNLLTRGDFDISCATVRNEMRLLGDEGYLEQPHISAGRIPTAKGYRMYVKQFMEPTAQEKMVKEKFTELREQYFQRKDQELAYDSVALLSQMIPHVAFVTVPHKERVYYLGLANTLKQPEFQSNPFLATGVVEVLESSLSQALENIEIDTKVRYYIGEDHLLPQIQSCSMMVTGYSLHDHEGVVGILGPMRMDYAYNTAALEMVADLLRRA